MAFEANTVIFFCTNCALKQNVKKQKLILPRFCFAELTYKLNIRLRK